MSTGMPWVRLHTDFINDEKLGALTRSAKLRFFELLALAGQLNAGGSIASGGEAPQPQTPAPAARPAQALAMAGRLK